MGDGPLGAESLPLEEESAGGGGGVELGVAEGSCGGAGMEGVVEPLAGCVL